ncbi:MAG: restriction endonuclease subunit M, partial [Prevotellaceae bacterium]|nr:restriction endonuclease subunit M [Prevotellaceae bacterium]
EGIKPKPFAIELGNTILSHFNKDALLVDAYDVYDVLMNYWNETMQDDCYLISEEGWKATLYVPQPADKKTQSGEIKKTKRKEARTIADFACDLLPIEFVIKRYCSELYTALLAAEERLSGHETQKAEMEEKHKDDYLNEAHFEGDTITDISLKKREKSLKAVRGNEEELGVIVGYIDIRQEISAVKSVIKVCHTELKEAVQKCYDTLTSEEVKDMVINDKWYGTLSKQLGEQMQQIGQQLTSSVIALVERYENTLPELDRSIENLEHKVTAHLKAMGFNWV